MSSWVPCPGPKILGILYSKYVQEVHYQNHGMSKYDKSYIFHAVQSSRIFFFFNYLFIHLI